MGVTASQDTPKLDVLVLREAFTLHMEAIQEYHRRFEYYKDQYQTGNGDRKHLSRCQCLAMCYYHQLLERNQVAPGFPLRMPGTAFPSRQETTLAREAGLSVYDVTNPFNPPVTPNKENHQLLVQMFHSLLNYQPQDSISGGLTPESMGRVVGDPEFRRCLDSAERWEDVRQPIYRACNWWNSLKIPDTLPSDLSSHTISSKEDQGPEVEPLLRMRVLQPIDE